MRHHPNPNLSKDWREANPGICLRQRERDFLTALGVLNPPPPAPTRVLTVDDLGYAAAVRHARAYWEHVEFELKKIGAVYDWDNPVFIKLLDFEDEWEVAQWAERQERRKNAKLFQSSCLF